MRSVILAQFCFSAKIYQLPNITATMLSSQETNPTARRMNAKWTKGFDTVIALKLKPLTINVAISTIAPIHTGSP